jgi:cytidine deaminase
MKPWIINLTIKTAKKSSYPRFRHGAVFTSGGRILFKSCNVEKSFSPQIGKSIHAEVSGLKAVLSKSRLRDKTSINLYVARVNTRNEVVLSKPCPNCMKKIIESGIVDNIYYSTNTGWEEIAL